MSAISSCGHLEAEGAFTGREFRQRGASQDGERENGAEFTLTGLPPNGSLRLLHSRQEKNESSWVAIECSFCGQALSPSPAEAPFERALLE